MRQLVAGLACASFICLGGCGGGGSNPDTPKPALSEATFESISGHSTAVLASIDRDANNLPRVRASGAGLPNTVLLRLISTGMLGICSLEAQLSSSRQAGLFQGELRADWLPGSFADGQFLKERPCFAGQAHHAQTVDFAVFLGAQGDALMGALDVRRQQLKDGLTQPLFNTFGTGFGLSLNASGSPEPSSGRR